MKEKELARWALRYAASRGADATEIYWFRGRGDTTQWRDGLLNEDRRAERRGFSVRLLKEGVPAFAYGTLMEKESLRRAVDDALLACDFLDPDPHFHFTPPGQTYPVVTPGSSGEVSAERKTRLLESMTAKAAAVAEVKRVERASFSATERRISLLNSLGLDLSRETAYVAAAVTTVAERDGEEQLGGDFRVAATAADLDGDDIAAKAAADAVENLGASPLTTGEYPVLLRPDAVLSLLGLLLPSFLGDKVAKGLSRLGADLGKVVAASAFSLVDDGLLPESVVKTAFDDEGQPCRRNVLVENGVLKGFLYNNRWGSKAAAASTGNGLCGSHKTLPGVGLHAYAVAPGTTSPQRVIAGLKRGLWVKDLMGLHMADAVSGDFSLGVVGVEIRDGEAAGAIRGSMVAGNLFDLLKEIETVCDDVTVVGDVAAPSFLIKSLKISGK